MLEGKLNQIAVKDGRKSLAVAAKFLLSHFVRGLKTKSSNLSVFNVRASKNHFYVE